MTQPVPPPSWRPADATTLREAVAGAGGGGEVAGPSFGAYVFALVRWLWEGILELFGRAFPSANPEQLERIVVAVALVGGGFALAVLVWALLRSLLGRRGHAARTEVASLPAAAAAAAAGDAEHWWQEVDRLLDRGALRSALTALWWWVARRLDPPGLAAAWTTGELVRAPGGAPLAAPLRRLDHLLWGAAGPRREQVEGLRDELRSRLGPPAGDGGAAAGGPASAAEPRRGEGR